MTRVLFWNIENFGLNKIFSPSRVRRMGHGGLTDAQAAAQRRVIIQAVLNAANPDIIVVIEVSSGDNHPNALATQTGGMEAMANIQFQLNASGLFPGGWNLVPPLYTGVGGVSESVGILYRRQNSAGTTFRFFTGPNIWTAGGYAGTSQDPATGLAPAPYPVPAMVGQVNIHSMLVPPLPPPAVAPTVPRAIPAVAQHNAGLNENVVAARIYFDNTMGAPVAFAGLREPFMATFTETGPGPGFALQRDLTLFGIHSPPNGVAATAYMLLLATIQEIVGPLGANETRVIGGDFNRNLLAANGTASGAYAALTGAGYTLLIAPTAGGIPVNVDQYIGYFSTHIRGASKTATSKFLWSDPASAAPSAYPGYGYVGSNFVTTPFYAIDNILVWPHRGAPYNYNTTIMNTVVGTPMNAVAMPADNPPVGAIAMAHQFGAPGGAWPPAPGAPNYVGIGAATNLVSWANYRRIKNTSDHFGVVADV